MPYLDRPWGRMHYRLAGRGPLVVLGHAFPLDGGMWEATLTDLASDFTVAAYDQRGFGHSDPSGSYGLDEVAEDVLALAHHLGAPTFAFVGLSMGGYVGMAIARRVPDAFWALALADTKAGADTPEAREKRLATAEALLQPAGRAAWLDGLASGLLGPTSRVERPAVVTSVQAAAERAAVNAVRSALGAMAARPDSHAALGAVRAPALVLVGAEDGVTPPAEAERLASALPKAEAPVVLPNAGHLSNLEAPEAFLGALKPFLVRHAARP